MTQQISEPPPVGSPAASGTPKKGIDCGECDDWGTVVIKRGRTLYEEICPTKDCKAAARVREQRRES